MLRTNILIYFQPPSKFLLTNYLLQLHHPPLMYVVSNKKILPKIYLHANEIEGTRVFYKQIAVCC